MPRVARFVSGAVLIVAGSIASCADTGNVGGTTGAASTAASAAALPEISSREQATSASVTEDKVADATALAKAMSISSVKRIVTITEDNDPNNKIGRPNGYVSAAVMYERSASCHDLGVDCGATIEVWPTKAAAEARSEYIQSMVKAAPILGDEYNQVHGTALLRVTGKVKPSLWKEYRSAFLSQ